ncbi:integrator complex subunit 8-like isoform X2 [Uloborus diversus]|uniref:integrator complex subunit 8-like isoform X2 n=1 Tax=Uloborus diversus TaxID=327109 RepID=UPI002409B39D|nr:integrator complex subunit 8-like isoform X2 [Uloborus diversus]
MFDSRAKQRPPSPQKILWFEFLLNPTLLEKHLSDGSTDPSPTDLIIKFLTNSVNESHSDQAMGLNNNQYNNSGVFSTGVPVNGMEEPPSQIDLDLKEEKITKKKIALKLLALKVAASLQWDLNTLEKKLPLTMQQSLLTELLTVTGDDLSFSDPAATSDSLFARILYNLWVLRAVIEGSYPAKSPKGLNVQLPGLIDPSIISPAVVESIMRKLNEETERACNLLEAILKNGDPVRMPLMNCFGTLTEECPNPDHKWDQGLMLKSDDVICQISYDLGCFYFFQEKYEEASAHFLKASDLYSKLVVPKFCHINPMKLKGFYDACAHILGYQKSDSTTPLREILQTSVKEGHNKTIDILKSDIIKMELPLSLRDAVELNILQEHEGKTDLLLYVVFSNAIRRTISGEVVINNWCSLLKTHEEKSSLIVCDLLKDVIPVASQEMKLFLKNFTRTLCLTSIPAKQLMKKYDKYSEMLFTAEELETLFAYGPTAKREIYKFDKSFTDDFSVQIAAFERRLLTCTEAVNIKYLVNQLRAKYNYQHLWTLNKKWECPVAVNIFLKNVPPHVDQEMIHILLAKAAELRAIKKYGEARHLYQMIHSEIRNASPRLSRFLNWELLRLDLLEVLDTPVHICQSSTYRTDIVQRILTLLVSYKKERGKVPPDPNLMELCAAVLLNFREWEKLLELEAKIDSYIQFSKVVASACKEMLNKGGKNGPRELWDTILPIFQTSTSVQHKRSGSGMVKDSSRETSQAIMTRSQLQQFIKKLKDTLVLGIIISCLAKFYNILKDDSIGEIFLEYQGIWPTIITNSDGFNMTAVGEVFQSTLHHALSIHPTHTAWLRTKGDVMYALISLQNSKKAPIVSVHGHYACALKYYISAAMVSSDFFSLPLPKAIFDDLQFKHMIHCCTKLCNHTQAAVLHQFLEEPNYTMAFKALGERVCNDSCDTYYPCIWDVTLLEFLVHHHTKRGEMDCRQYVIQLIGQLELNSNNNEEIQREAASLRKGWFLRAMAKQYL